MEWVRAPTMMEHIDRLVDEVVRDYPLLSRIIQRSDTDITAGDWDLVAHSFDQAFEVLWSQATILSNGLLDRPLLMIWRQSIELSIKAAILDYEKTPTAVPGHNLEVLFARLRVLREEAGYSDEDEYTAAVTAVVAGAQKFDPFADRFRYPSSRSGKPFEGMNVNLDDLFKAHWIVANWCGAAALDAEQARGTC